MRHLWSEGIEWQLESCTGFKPHENLDLIEGEFMREDYKTTIKNENKHYKNRQES